MPWPCLGILLGNMCRTWLARGSDSQPVLYISVCLNYIRSDKCYPESLAQLQSLHLKQTPVLPTGWETALGSGANMSRDALHAVGWQEKSRSFTEGWKLEWRAIRKAILRLLQEWLLLGQQEDMKTPEGVKENQWSETAAGKWALWIEDQDAFCLSDSRLRSDLITAGGWFHLEEM